MIIKSIIVTLIFLLSFDLHSEESEINLDNTEVNNLEMLLVNSHNNIIKKMPENIHNELLGIKSFDDFYKLSESTQIWVEQNVSQVRDVEISNIFTNFTNVSYLHGDDVSKILRETFILKVGNKKLDLKNKIEMSMIYWIEQSIPIFNASPEGNGKITWIWKLPTKERKLGVIHVGLDDKSRRFICYERNRGIYYAEGEILERIRAEIVQNTDMASGRVGKGYFENKERQK